MVLGGLHPPVERCPARTGPFYFVLCSSHGSAFALVRRYFSVFKLIPTLLAPFLFLVCVCVLIILVVILLSWMILFILIFFSAFFVTLWRGSPHYSYYYYFLFLVVVVAVVVAVVVVIIRSTFSVFKGYYLVHLFGAKL